MHILFGFLLFAFIIHFLAFTVLAVVRRKYYYFLLSGTFVFLSVIYYFKFQRICPNFPNTAVSVIVTCRVLAVSCTAAYLFTIARLPGTWLSRLLRRG
ncbi:MAG: hypothetical protein A3G34_13390 [Candidatus Lindowbacteria bacterium RIFCSPLOWO2_12_FULL_62_27]|nr:MAG: hypothetical protein A3I06_11065 [Candidatus Lindowbacteria bacterium RIFCSPLOWO2_02_FULL_62_12]OGH62577.1 MAG: hypothetical protein A3G34_13390 [Candidatus Lindowbacteria bacterium RIFCSPLOWO2_12_FULL_62_27]